MKARWTGRKSKRKGLAHQDNLNLVPFIDLFSTLIMFLIATSVWQQLAALPVNLGSPNADDRTVSQPNKNDVKSIKADVRITLAKDSITLFDNGTTKTLSMAEAKANEFGAIRDFVGKVRARDLERREILLAAGDQTVYADLIAVMDRCLEQEFSQIVVTGTDTPM